MGEREGKSAVFSEGDLSVILK
jgi:hypothetical protein